MTDDNWIRHGRTLNTCCLLALKNCKKVFFYERPHKKKRTCRWFLLYIHFSIFDLSANSYGVSDTGSLKQARITYSEWANIWAIQVDSDSKATEETKEVKSDKLFSPQVIVLPNCLRNSWHAVKFKSFFPLDISNGFIHVIFYKPNERKWRKNQQTISPKWIFLL